MLYTFICYILRLKGISSQFKTNFSQRESVLSQAAGLHRLPPQNTVPTTVVCASVLNSATFVYPVMLLFPCTVFVCVLISSVSLSVTVGAQTAVILKGSDKGVVVLCTLAQLNCIQALKP